MGLRPITPEAGTPDRSSSKRSKWDLRAKRVCVGYEDAEGTH